MKSPITKELEKLAVQTVTDDFSYYDKLTTQLRTKFVSCYKLYSQELDESAAENLSNLFIPYPFSNVQVVHARAFARPPKFVLIPRKWASIRKTEVNRTVLAYQFDMANAMDEIESVGMWAWIYGTSFAQVVYRNDEYYEGPAVLGIDTFDFFAHPNIEYICDQRSHITRFRNVEIDELKQDKEHYFGINSYDYGKDTSGENDPFITQRNAVIGTTDDGTDGKSNPNRRQGEILQWQGNLYGDEWGEFTGKFVVMEVLNRKKLVRFEDDPYGLGGSNVVKLVDQRRPGELYGDGEIAPYMSLFKELNDTRNQGMDSRNLANATPIIIDESAFEDPDEIKFISAAKWRVKAGTNVSSVFHQVILADVAVIADKIEKQIKEDIQLTSGVSPLFSGVNDKTVNDTATGLALIAEQGDMRFRKKIKNLEKFISEVAQKFIKITSYFVDKDLMIRVAGPDGMYFKNIKKGDISDDFDIQVEAGSTVAVNESEYERKAIIKSNLLMKYFPNHDGSYREEILADAFNLDIDRARGKLPIEDPYEEWEQIKAGKQLEPTMGADLAHIRIEQAISNMSEFENAKPEVKQAFLTHIKGETLTLRGEMAPPPNTEGQAGGPTLRTVAAPGQAPAQSGIPSAQGLPGQAPA